MNGSLSDGVQRFLNSLFLLGVRNFFRGPEFSLGGLACHHITEIKRERKKDLTMEM
jgi:hypothetical protein